MATELLLIGTERKYMLLSCHILGTASQTDKLQHVLNSAARLITGTKKFDHISPVICDLHWLPIDKRILFKLLCITYKSLNRQAPQYLESQLQPYIPTRVLVQLTKCSCQSPKSEPKSTEPGLLPMLHRATTTQFHSLFANRLL